MSLRSAWSVALVALAVFSCGEPSRATLERDPALGGSGVTPTASASAPIATASAVASSAALATAQVSAEVTASAVAPEGPASTPLIADPTTPIDGSFLANAKDGILKPGFADKIIGPGRMSGVILVSAGAEPHERLRYKFGENAKQTTLMRTKTSMVSPQQSVTLPTVEMTLELSTGALDAATGLIAVSGALTQVEVKPAEDAQSKKMAAAMAPGLQFIKGMSVGYLVDPLGKATDVSLKVAGPSNAATDKLIGEMKHQFESLVPPLPEQPIGVGAEWQVIQRVNSGVEILQWTTYKLTKKKGDKIKLTATVQQLAASATVMTPQKSAAPVILLSYDGSGSAETRMALSSIGPDAGVGSVKNVIRFEEAKRPITTETLVKLEFERKK